MLVYRLWGSIVRWPLAHMATQRCSHLGGRWYRSWNKKVGFNCMQLCMWCRHCACAEHVPLDCFGLLCARVHACMHVLVCLCVCVCVCVCVWACVSGSCRSGRWVVILMHLYNYVYSLVATCKNHHPTGCVVYMYNMLVHMVYCVIVILCVHWNLFYGLLL